MQFLTISNAFGAVLRLRRGFKGFINVVDKIEPSDTDILIVNKSQNPLKWNIENWNWSWESNFIPFNKKFKCTRKCARDLARYSNSESDIMKPFSFILNRFRKPKRGCCC